MTSPDFNINLLYLALDCKRESQGLTWAGVAKEIENRYTKVSPTTIKGIRDKNFVEGDGCLQMLLWLGRSPESFVAGIKSSKKHELREPKNTVLRFDVKEVYRLLEAKRSVERLTWQEVSEQVGDASPRMLQRFKGGGRTSFPIIVRIARWLKTPVKNLTIENPW